MKQPLEKYATKLPKDLIVRLREHSERTGVRQTYFVAKALEKALREAR